MINVAERLAGHPCVTVSVDDLYFESEVELGQIINLHAQVNRAFNTSMEVRTLFCLTFLNIYVNTHFSTNFYFFKRLESKCHVKV